MVHQTQSSRYIIDFSYEESEGRRHRKCIRLDKSCKNMYTIFSAVLRQQRKSDVVASFGHSAIITHTSLYSWTIDLCTYVYIELKGVPF
jgi:hypothetical protein